MARTAEPKPAAVTEYREETCPDCHWARERQWRVSSARAGGVPRGWRVERRSPGGWLRIAAPTRMVTLCGCDTP